MRKRRKTAPVPEQLGELNPEQLFELGMRIKYGRHIMLSVTGPLYSNTCYGDMVHASADLSLLKEQEQKAYWDRAGLRGG